MLAKRIATGIILALAVLAALIGLTPKAFALVSAVFMLVAAWEWATLSAIDVHWEQAVYLIMVMFSMLLANVLAPQAVLIAAMLWWLLAIFLLACYPKAQKYWATGSLWRAFMGVFAIVPAWLALNLLKQSHLNYLLLLILLVCAADIGAFFAGRRFGKTLLAPRVSPKKTWAGVFGGMALALLVIVIAGLSFLKLATWQAWLTWLGIALLMVPVSVLGDLFESMLKRVAGVKDSGRLLPGHGGVLDRIDGFLMAAPVFALLLAL